MTEGGWFSRRIPSLILGLVLIQYVFVQLAFSTLTMNIVMVKDIAFPLLALLILSLWAAGELAYRGRWELRPSGVNLPIACMILFLAHSSATSPIPAASLEEFMKFFSGFFLLCVIAKFLDDRVWLGRALATIAVTSLLMTLYGFSQWADHDLLFWIGRGTSWGFPGWGGQRVFVSTHGSQNFLSGVLIVTIPLLAGWWLSTKRPFLLIALPVLIAAMAFCVVEAESRGAQLGLVAAMILFLAALAVNARRLAGHFDFPRMRLLAGGAALVLGPWLLAAVVRPDLARKPITRTYANLSSIFDIETYNSVAVRPVLWQDFLDGGLREPFAGRGLGVGNARMPETRPNWYHHIGVSHNTMHAHNEIFEWILEGGILGTSLYLWILIALFASWLRTLFRRRGDSDFPLLLGVGLGLFAQCLQCLFDPSTRWTGNACANWFSAGFMIAWSNLPPPEDLRRAEAWGGEFPSRPSRLAPWAAGFSIPLLLFAGLVATRVWMADYYHRNANAFTEGRAIPENLRKGRVFAQKCEALNPYHLSNYYKLAYARLALGDFENARRSYKDLQAIAPNYAQVHINLSYVEHSLGNRYGSAWERDRAAIIEDNTRNHVSAAEYWAMLGLMDYVLPHLRHALKIDRDDDDGSRSQLFYQHDDIHYRIAQAMGQAGDVERAVRELENALSRNPGHPQALYQLLQVYYLSGRTNDADSLIASIRTRFPDSELLYLAEADRAFRMGDLDAALAAARRLADFFPWPEPGTGSGNTSINLVAQIAQNSIQRGSNLPVAYALIGRAYAAVGDYDKACGILYEADRLAPDDTWVEAQFDGAMRRKNRR